jgi:hypothetical protein
MTSVDININGMDMEETVFIHKDYILAKRIPEILTQSLAEKVRNSALPIIQSEDS